MLDSILRFIMVFMYCYIFPLCTLYGDYYIPNIVYWFGVEYFNSLILCCGFICLFVLNIVYIRVGRFYYLKHFVPNKKVRVVSWAEANDIPDLNSGRWVLIGRKSKFNHMRTIAPYFDSRRKHLRSYDNCIVGEIELGELDINWGGSGKWLFLGFFFGHLQINKKENDNV